jgi:hypothetical protein
MPVQLRLLSVSLILLGLFGGQVTFAQWRTLEEDVVYLKNGSIIRGKIKEQIPGEYIKIELVSDTIFTLGQSEVEKITREPTKYMSIRVKKYKKLLPFTYRQKGLYQHVSFGAGFTTGRFGEPSANLAFNYRIGYHFHHLFNLGAGTGFDIYDGSVITPFFLDLWGDLKESPVTPTYMANIGYGYGLSGSWRHDVFDGGLLAHLALGLKFNTRSKREYVFTVGYKRQDTYQEFASLNWRWDPWATTQSIVRGTRIYQRIMWQFSFGF